jgi:hypothetical protein
MNAARAASLCTVPSNNNAAFQSAFLKPRAGRFWTKFDSAEGPIERVALRAARASSTSPHPAPSAVASGCRLSSLSGIRLRLCG